MGVYCIQSVVQAVLGLGKALNAVLGKREAESLFTSSHGLVY